MEVRARAEEVGAGVEEYGGAGATGGGGRRWRGRRGTAAVRAEEDGGAFRQPGGVVLRGAQKMIKSKALRFI